MSITTEQGYLDVLYNIQCCYGELVYQLYQQQYIGFECSDLEDKVRMLYAIRRALLRQDITLTDDDACLTEDEINSLIDKAKKLCNDCCFEHIDRPDA